MKTHAGTLVLTLWGLGCSDVSRSEAESAATSWTAQHADGWAVKLDRPLPPEGFHLSPSSGGCPDGRFGVSAQTRAADLGLFFNCPQTGIVDFDWIQANLQSYSLEPLSVAVDVDGWTFVAYPTQSSLETGLTFESWVTGHVALHVETPLFALVGANHSGGCAAASMVADGGDPDCFVSVPFQGPLVLDLTLSLDPELFKAAIPIRQ